MVVVFGFKAGGYETTGVGWPVRKITREVMNGFEPHFEELLIRGQGADDCMRQLEVPICGGGPSCQKASLLSLTF